MFRNYIADSLRLLTENTAKMVKGNYMAKRYTEIVDPKQKKADGPEESGEEIADNVIDIVSRLAGD